MVDDERGGGTGGEGQTTGNPPLPGTIRRFIIKTGCLEASVVQIKPANIWIFYFRAASERKRERERESGSRGVLLPIRWPASLIRFVINTSAAVGVGKLPLPA